MLLLIDRKTTAEMVLPLTTRLRSWRHNAWLVGNESRRSASRSPAQRAGGQHSTNKNLFPHQSFGYHTGDNTQYQSTIAFDVTTKALCSMATSSPLLFFSQSTKRCCSQFWESTKSKFWTEFDCSVTCYWQATTGKLAVEWTLIEIAGEYWGRGQRFAFEPVRRT